MLFLIPSITMDSLHSAGVQLGKANCKLPKEKRQKWEWYRKMRILKNCISQSKKRRETIKNGRPRGHSFDHRFILLYFGGKMRPCSLCWKQKTWREAGFSFKYDFMKKKKTQNGQRSVEWRLTNPISDWVFFYLQGRSLPNKVGASPKQKRCLLVLISKTCNILAAHAW